MSEKRFEDTMNELKSVVAKLEREDIDLDEAIDLYKRGVELSKECKIKLDSAEKIVKSVIDENGNRDDLSDEY